MSDEFKDLESLREEQLIDYIYSLRKKLKIATEALEFYADKTKWEYWHNHDHGAHKDWNTFRPEVWCGGKKAREALDKLKKELEK